MFNIWIYDKNKGKGKPDKLNLSTSEAFDYVIVKQKSLKPNQQLITEEVKTGKVDMIFEKDSTTTPREPLKFNKNGVLGTANQFANDSNWKSTQRSNYERTGVIAYDMTTPPSRFDFKDGGSKRTSKPKSNSMWRMSNKQIYDRIKSGYLNPKQRRFASYVLSTRNKNR